MKYDVIIVGTGPAGASAALELARSDMRVLIIEKESLPREKPCGGAMPSSVEKLLNIDISPVVKKRIGIIQTYHNYQNNVMNSLDRKNALILVNRSEFDMYLLEQAKKIGEGNIEVLEKCSVVSVKETPDEVHMVLDNGKELQAKYLIGADGALGKIASMTGLMKNRKFAPALDAEIITSDHYYENYSDTMVLNFFCLSHGYGWIFPKEKNKFSCGVGTWGKPLNLKKELHDFLRKSFPENTIQKIQISGYPIPIYNGTQQISTDRVLLTGDAAALVDPVTGEGIRFALHSGKIAASIIVKVLTKNLGSLTNYVSEEYQEVIHNEIGKELKFKLAFASLAFHSSPELYYKKFIKKTVYRN